MYFPKKDFNKELTKWIVKPLKKYGFKKYKTGKIVRITSGHILQYINFQKTGDFEFFVNISSIPLCLGVSQIGSGQIRINNFQKVHEFSDSSGAFSFKSQLYAELSLKEVCDTIERKIIPWFDMQSSAASIIAYEKNNDGEPESTIPTYQMSSRKWYIGYSLLWEKSCEEAYEYLQDEIFNRDEDLNFFSEMIKRKDFNKIEVILQKNIDQSLENLKLRKLEPVECTPLDISEFLNIFKNDTCKRLIPGEGGVRELRFFFDVNPNSLDVISNILVKELGFESIRISSNWIAMKTEEGFYFYFYYNDRDYVTMDSQEIADYCIETGKKKNEIELIRNSISRIEFWYEFSLNLTETLAAYKVNHVHLIESLLSEKFSNLFWVPGRWIFVDDKNY